MADSSRDIESKAVDNVFTHESDAKADLSLGHDHEIREKYGQTKRGLTPRHVQLMAIGGSIGTGLFVGIGGVLATAGPLSVFLGYLFWGILFIWPANLCVAEMCAYLPIRGSIFELASRFIDPALGFAMGWTYFYAGVMLVCVEYSAVATIMQYWITDINPAAWIAMAMAICILLNVVAVKWYGEAEFVMASAKVILLIGLVLLTFITMVGGNPKGDAYGFRHWTNGNAMHSYYTSGATGRFLGWFHVVKFAGFTLGGPDFLALASGEIQNPRRTIPRVAKLVFYRLVGFYVIGVLAVGIICSSTDSRLLGAIESGAPGAAASPWVVGIMNMDIPFLPHIINFLVLTSGLSCGNAYLFSSSRTLYGLARDGQAPKFLLKCTKNGIPIYAVGIVSAITCITFLASSNSAVETLFWFIDLTATGLITSYTLMLVTFIGWYRARKSQGLPESSLHYIAPLTPWWPSLAILLGCLTLFFVGFDTIVPFDKQGFITSYFCLPYTAVLYFGWKLWKKTTLVRPKTADLFAGKAEVDEECREWEEGGIDENYKKALSEMGFWKRTWEKIW